MSREPFADLFLVADDDMGSGIREALVVHLIPGADNDMGLGGLLPNLFKYRHRGSVIGNRDDDGLGSGELQML